MNYFLTVVETFFIILVAELPYLLLAISVGYLMTKIFNKQYTKLLNMLFDETDEKERSR